MNEYEVSVSCNFEAESPEDALAQMVAWITENGDSVGYRIKNNETLESIFIDAEKIDLNGFYLYDQYFYK